MLCRSKTFIQLAYINGDRIVTTRPLFHEQLRYEREVRGWSQADLAEKVQCDTKTIERWERAPPAHITACCSAKSWERMLKSWGWEKKPPGRQTHHPSRAIIPTMRKVLYFRRPQLLHRSHPYLKKYMRVITYLHRSCEKTGARLLMSSTSTDARKSTPG